MNVEGNASFASVCLSVRALTFEIINLETSFLVCSHNFRLSASFVCQGHWVKVKVTLTAGSILGVESNQNVESKTKNVESKIAFLLQEFSYFLAFWSVDSQENH